MPSIAQSLLVPFTSQQMYDLVNDVAAYPEFVPWCKSATVHAKAVTALSATLCIGKGPITQTIATNNTMIPNQQIKMQYQSGSLKNCFGAWDFVDQNDGTQCQVRFNMQYEFNSRLHALTLEPILYPLASTLIDAFYKRAQKIYGV